MVRQATRMRVQERGGIAIGDVLLRVVEVRRDSVELQVIEAPADTAIGGIVPCEMRKRLQKRPRDA